jgi:general stress protein 26
MGDKINLENKEAIAKIKELAEGAGICMFCTELSKSPFSTRPMALQEVDEYGNLWFLSSSESNKNFEIKSDDKVQLLFSKMSDSHYLSIFGSAYIYKDKDKIEEMWSPIAKAWFKGGKDDPKVTVIRVNPEDTYYWDTKNGKMVSLLKIAVAVVTGKTMDDGLEGKLKV